MLLRVPRPCGLRLLRLTVTRPCQRQPLRIRVRVTRQRQLGGRRGRLCERIHGSRRHLAPGAGPVATKRMHAPMCASPVAWPAIGSALTLIAERALPGLVQGGDSCARQRRQRLWGGSACGGAGRGVCWGCRGCCKSSRGGRRKARRDGRKGSRRGGVSCRGARGTGCRGARRGCRGARGIDDEVVCKTGRNRRDIGMTSSRRSSSSSSRNSSSSSSSRSNMTTRERLPTCTLSSPTIFLSSCASCTSCTSADSSRSCSGSRSRWSCSGYSRCSGSGRSRSVSLPTNPSRPLPHPRGQRHSVWIARGRPINHAPHRAPTPLPVSSTDTVSSEAPSPSVANTSEAGTGKSGSRLCWRYPLRSQVRLWRRRQRLAEPDCLCRRHLSASVSVGLGRSQGLSTAIGLSGAAMRVSKGAKGLCSLQRVLLRLRLVGRGGGGRRRGGGGGRG